jgi:hypothetical protein
MTEPFATTQSTSLQRTYRYTRIAIAGCVLVIAVSVVTASIQLGEILPSVSAYFYTPARTTLVGALIAAGIGILSLSGRGLDRGLLAAAALFAPLIAIVPTRIAPGLVPGVSAPCPGNAPNCIPANLLATIQNGVITYEIIGLLGVIVAFGIAVGSQRLGDRAVLVSILIALIVILGVGASSLWLTTFFLQDGHIVFSGLFFLLLSGVALRSVFPFAAERRRSRLVKILFGIIGVAMTVDVAVLLIVVPFLPQGGDPVLIGESIALVLFFVFWLLQSGRDWNLADPASRDRHRSSATT